MSEPQDLSAIMPGVIASFGRMEAGAKAFAESIRPQFDAEPQTIPCPEAGHPIELPANFETTVRETRRNGVFTMSYETCPLCETRALQARQRAFWAKRGVPERVLDATGKNFVADTEAKKQARTDVLAWLQGRSLFLILFGTPGTGKGHLAAACLKQHGRGLFITHADMMMDLRASYVKHDTKALIERWQTAGMLVVDEFGLRSTGQDEEAMLYQVFAERYENGRRTIITTNRTLPEVRELLGYRLLDRVSSDCASVPMIWDSFRNTKTP